MFRMIRDSILNGRLGLISAFVGAATATTILTASISYGAAPRCEYVFTNPRVAQIGADFGLLNGKIQTPKELLEIKRINLDLKSALSSLPAERRARVEHLLDAVEFFDYTHTAEKILPNFLEDKKQSFDFKNLYDSYYDGISGAPFRGFLSARDGYLNAEKPAITPEILQNIHKNIMADGVEGVRIEQLGQWRDGHWMGNVAGDFKMKVEEIQAVQENPYLYFEEKNRGVEPVNGSLWEKIKVWGNLREMIATPEPQVLVEGRIHYPFVLTPKQETVDIIKDSHPDVYKSLMEIRALSKSQIVQIKPETEQMFTKALVEERFARFNEQKAALGSIEIGKNEQAYIDIVADFQRDLVAIHPVLNGNGRTTRMFLNYLLTSEGLPSVRLLDPFLDVQVTKENWREYVRKGVLNNAQLRADIAFRIKNGLVVEYSPELVYPGLPEQIDISLRKQGSAKEVKNYAKAKLETEQFNAFLRAIYKQHPQIRQELANNRLKTMSRLAELFVEFQKTKTIRFIHEKDSEAELRLRLIDPDFVDTFAVNKSANKEAWDAKLNRWYDRSMLAWRGLSNKYNSVSEAEILNYFKAPSTHLLSNSAGNAVRYGTPIITAIKADFETYNKELLSGDLVEMAIDHHRTGSRYGQSYGYSTSKREVVGKAFAMGAMVVGEYGQHQDPKLQSQLKSRINIASYRALKDIDLGRLKGFDPEFSYIYGRQAEVMGIGGTDPDAVMIIQDIDAAGNVKTTYLRDVLQPNQVLVIEGRYLPSEGPIPEDRVIKKVIL